MPEPMQELNKAWRELIDTLAKKLKLYKLLDFITNKLSSH